VARVPLHAPPAGRQPATQTRSSGAKRRRDRPPGTLQPRHQRQPARCSRCRHPWKRTPARSAGLDCHFESICESCTFFQTTIEFRPTLEKQRDDAAAKGQAGRKKIFDGLLSRLDEAVS
jgi:hypothetical protein